MSKEISIISGITLHPITKNESRATPDPRIGTVKKIADDLGVSIEDLTR